MGRLVGRVAAMLVCAYVAQASIMSRMQEIDNAATALKDLADEILADEDMEYSWPKEVLEEMHNNPEEALQALKDAFAPRIPSDPATTTLDCNGFYCRTCLDVNAEFDFRGNFLNITFKDCLDVYWFFRNESFMLVYIMDGVVEAFTTFKAEAVLANLPCVYVPFSPLSVCPSFYRVKVKKGKYCATIAVKYGSTAFYTPSFCFTINFIPPSQKSLPWADTLNANNWPEDSLL